MNEWEKVGPISSIDEQRKQLQSHEFYAENLRRNRPCFEDVAWRTTAPEITIPSVAELLIAVPYLAAVGLKEYFPDFKQKIADWSNFYFRRGLPRTPMIDLRLISQ
ncbi:MAG: hypothetical protein M1142_01645 [Patescibacteria group bacterium]|nr:hypothetical protein [Patescibacteria group bacterium]